MFKTVHLYFGSIKSVSLGDVNVPANYPLKLYGELQTKIKVNALLVKRVEAALNDIINHYGADIVNVAPAATKYCRVL